MLFTRGVFLKIWCPSKNFKQTIILCNCFDIFEKTPHTTCTCEDSTVICWNTCHHCPFCLEQILGVQVPLWCVKTAFVTQGLGSREFVKTMELSISTCCQGAASHLLLRKVRSSTSNSFPVVLVLTLIAQALLFFSSARLQVVTTRRRKVSNPSHFFSYLFLVLHLCQTAEKMPTDDRWVQCSSLLWVSVVSQSMPHCSSAKGCSTYYLLNMFGSLIIRLWLWQYFGYCHGKDGTCHRIATSPLFTWKCHSNHRRHWLWQTCVSVWYLA